MSIKENDNDLPTINFIKELSDISKISEFNLSHPKIESFQNEFRSIIESQNSSNSPILV